MPLVNNTRKSTGRCPPGNYYSHKSVTMTQYYVIPVFSCLDLVGINHSTDSHSVDLLAVFTGWGTVKGVKCDALLPNSCQQQLQSLLRHSKCVPTVKSSVKRNVRIFTSSTVKDVYIHSSKDEYRLQNLPIVIRQKTRNNLNLYFFFYFNSKFQMAKKFTVQRNIKRSC